MSKTEVLNQTDRTVLRTGTDPQVKGVCYGIQ